MSSDFEDSLSDLDDSDIELDKEPKPKPAKSKAQPPAKSKIPPKSVQKIVPKVAPPSLGPTTGKLSLPPPRRPGLSRSACVKSVL